MYPPLINSVLGATQTSSCLKCKFADACLIQMHWSCHCLDKYWKDIFHTLLKVLNIKLKPNQFNGGSVWGHGEENIIIN